MIYNKLFFNIIFRLSFVWLLMQAVTGMSANLVNIRYGLHHDGLRVVMETDQKLDFKTGYIDQAPFRYVLDTNRLTIKLKPEKEKNGQHYLKGYQFIKQIRHAISKNNKARFVFDLSSDVDIIKPVQLSPDKNHPYYRLVIDFKQKKNSKKIIWESQKIANAQSIKAGSSLKPAKKPAKKIKPEKKRTLFSSKPIIVIDAGHGGNDPGAISRGRKVKEKKITLIAAYELKKQLEKTKRYKVILTRTNDRYMSLDDRVAIARQNNASLFVSLHADSMHSKELRGASVYTLSNRAKQRAKKILEKQNWILDVDLKGHSNEVSNILVDLAQRETKTSSANLAEYIISELKSVTPVLRNTHRRAGYYVLLAPDVPAVLIEMGFLSNRKDEINLTSKRHRKKLMQAIKKAIDQYFKSQKQHYITSN